MGWDFSIQTDNIIEPQRYLVVVDIKATTCKIIDFPVPGDRIEDKKKQKLERVQVMRLALGSLGAKSKQFGKRLKDTDVTAEMRLLHKRVLLMKVSWIFPRISVLQCVRSIM